MSAIREVKFLQELKHENVIEVSSYITYIYLYLNGFRCWMSSLLNKI